MLHFINVQGESSPKGPPFECPCVSDRVFDYEKRTVDGTEPLAFACSQDLLDAHNDACQLEWYTGGYRCCENNASVIEPEARGGPADTVYAKFSFKVDDVTPKTKTVIFNQQDCTGSNAEYGIPACDHTTGEDCVHTVTLEQEILHTSLQEPGVLPMPWAKVEILTARGHQHVGGLGMEMYNAQTNELLCASRPTMGTGTEAGNEEGFVVGIPPCVFGHDEGMQAPPTLGRKDKVRLVSRYNSSGGGHLGVMCLWFMQVHVSAYLEEEGMVV